MAPPGLRRDDLIRPLHLSALNLPLQFAPGASRFSAPIANNCYGLTRLRMNFR